LPGALGDRGHGLAALAVGLGDAGQCVHEVFLRRLGGSSVRPARGQLHAGPWAGRSARPGGRVLHVRLVRCVHCTRASAAADRSPPVSCRGSPRETVGDRERHSLTYDPAYDEPATPAERLECPELPDPMRYRRHHEQAGRVTAARAMTAVRAAMKVAAKPRRVLELGCKVAEDPRRKC